jgi:hypothetical protein
VVIIACNRGGVDILISQCTIRDMLYVGPKGIPHLSIVEGAGQIGITRGNIPGGPNIGGVAYVGLIKRVKYTIVICTDPARSKTIARGIILITDGRGALLPGDVGQLLADVDA